MKTLTRSQVRDIDRRAIEDYGIPGIVLMENAGRSVAQVLMQLNAQRRPVVVVCGKGNNGGDGFVIARHLDIAGWPVSIWPLVHREEYRGDAAVNCEIAFRSEIPIFAGPPPIETETLDRLQAWNGWIVDALFGTGLSGPVGEPYDRVIAAINSSSASVLAVDIPSGLDCDSGEASAPTVQADHTVTFVAMKAGFLTSTAQKWLGEVAVADIGAPRKLLSEYGIH
jgi:NAD(P)H-hydrate epimerase